MEKILPISLRLNFTSNNLGCYGSNKEGIFSRFRYLKSCTRFLRLQNLLPFGITANLLCPLPY